MSGNSETTASSIKFAPMPMSELLANLLPLHSDSPDASFSSADESDNSFGETVAKKPEPLQKNSDAKTPIVKPSQPNYKQFTSEKKIIHNEHNKENTGDNWSSNLTYPSKDSIIQTNIQTQPNKDRIVQSAHKNVSKYPSSDIKKRSVLMQQSNNIRTQSSAIKRTPEMARLPSSTQKQKTATPKIKSGIRRFTPSSNSKSKKKTPQKNLVQNRDRVRCELFTHKNNDEGVCPLPKPEQVPKNVPETPLNMKAMPAPYVATPSYPQSSVGNNSKISLKITSIRDKKYLFMRKLGVGGSSDVFKALEVSTSCEYAVKCVYLGSDQEMAQGYINEVRLLRELQNSDRVVRLYDYEYDRSNQLLRLVLEVGETDLSSILKARGAGLPPALLLHYWEEMLHAVAYIHEHGVIHADLKPANFLLVCGRLKLIDFGIASAISSDATSVVRAAATGTFSYISPEALMGGAGGYGSDNGSAPIKISFRSDVWSLGCILYSMVYKRTPFAHIPNLAKLAAIVDPNHRIDYPPVERLCPSLIAAMKWCLTYNARARPTVRDLLAILGTAPLPQHILDKLHTFVTPKSSPCCRGLCNS